MLARQGDLAEGARSAHVLGLWLAVLPGVPSNQQRSLVMWLWLGSRLDAIQITKLNRHFRGLAKMWCDDCDKLVLSTTRDINLPLGNDVGIRILLQHNLLCRMCTLPPPTSLFDSTSIYSRSLRTFRNTRVFRRGNGELAQETDWSSDWTTTSSDSDAGLSS